MSITLELSPEIEKQLAQMPEHERTHFIANAIREKLSEGVEEDPAVWVAPPGDDALTEEETMKLRELIHSEEAPEPSEALKLAIQHWRYLKGSSPKAPHG